MCVCVFVCVQFVCQERENGKAYMVKKKKKSCLENCEYKNVLFLQFFP